MDYSVLLNLLIKVFLLISLGYFLKKRAVVSEELEDGLSDLLMRVVIPVSIVGSATTKFSGDVLKNIGFIALFAFFYYLLSLVIMRQISLRMPISSNKQIITMMMTVFANTSFLGFPVMTELYGQEGLIYAVVYNLFYQLFFFTYAISLISGDKKVNLLTIAKNPSNIAVLVAALLFVLPFQLPKALTDTMNSLSSMIVPISMMLIGCSLAKVKLSAIFKDRISYFVSGLRLLIFPCIMLFVTRLIGLDPKVCAVASLMTALPTGSLNVIVAKQYQCEPDYAASTVVQCMIFSIFTIPLMIYLCNLLL